MAYQIKIANREINPRVINFFTFENQVTTLEFTLDNYMYDEVDLRNYKAYAVTSINGSVDLTELDMRYDDVNDKLTLTWNVGDYTLTETGAIIYQITFKENEDDGQNSAVWYSYKSVMINRGTVDADYKITAEYPTIMKQWLDKMGAMEDELIKVKDKGIDDIEEATDESIEEINELAAKFDTSVVYIPYGETIPVENRLSNRLYYQYTDETHTKGRFEDSNGVILNLDPTGYVTCIGQTIFSLLPINNAGLHLLDGTKLLGDGAYSAFVEYVAKLHDKSLNCFCTEDEWQQSVTNYGVCGKFVYNADENSVRLPKVTGFVEGTIDPYALGNLVEAGLPNITGKFEAKGFNSDYGTINYGSGAFDVKVAAGYDETANAGSNNLVNTDVAEFDASQSNDIYGNANTVQPQAIKGYYYMVIATSDIEEVGINSQSGTFLNQFQITNCLLEIPQRINYTLENNRLTVKAGSVMIVPYGTEDLTDQYPVGSAFLHENFKVYDTQFVDGKFFVLVETREDLKNKYSAATRTNHVFVSVNLGYGLTATDVALNTSGDTDTGSGTYRFWYDTANNIVKKFESDTVNPVEDVFALPIMVAQSKVSVGWESINEVFNGFGYIDSVVWVDKDVRGLIPDGRNIDGSLNNVEFTIRNVSIMDTSSVYDGSYTLYLHKDTGLAVGSYWEYDEKTNSFKHESSYNYGILCEAGRIKLLNGQVTSLKPKTTFRAIDYNDVKSLGGDSGGSGRNVGDIFYTSRLDTELNGAVECNGGFYSTEDFAGSQSIDSLLKNNSLPYVSLTEYTSQITTNGYCRAFGWDGGTSFRVPTIPALLLTKDEASVVGNGYSLGLNQSGLDEETDYLPLRTGSVGSGGGRTIQWKKGATKTLAGSAFPDGTAVQVESANLSVGVSKNPEYSGLISNLPVVEYRAMVQIANGATDEAVITATSALQQIANKVDRSEADYVVEEYKDGDDWYRVYKSGWVEQGGRVVPSTSWKGVVLLKPMADSYYSVMVTNCGEDVTRYAVKAGTPSKNTATTVYVTAGNDSTGVYWQVKGQGA